MAGGCAADEKLRGVVDPFSSWRCTSLPQSLTKRVLEADEVESFEGVQVEVAVGSSSTGFNTSPFMILDELRPILGKVI